MTDLPFKRVVVDPAAKDMPYAALFLSRVEGLVPVEILPEGSDPPTGRGSLFLTVRKGQFLKDCPCTPGAVECGYRVFSPLTGCPYACSYCFLRFYAPDEPLTLYANVEEAEAEFRAFASTLEKPARIGTGEFADSLALDRWTRHAGWMASLAADFPLALIELKTKSGDPTPLLKQPALPNLIGAWSVNPPDLAEGEEAFAAPVGERLEAAAEVARSGRPVAFHFDPVIVGEGWRERYGKLVEALFAAAPPETVKWISFGTLRFPRRFLDLNGPKVRGNPIFFGEMATGGDGKLRYLWPERREVYRFLAGEVKRLGRGFARSYLCMEPEPMWEAVYGRTPPSRPVERLFW